MTGEVPQFRVQFKSVSHQKALSMAESDNNNRTQRQSTKPNGYQLFKRCRSNLGAGIYKKLNARIVIPPSGINKKALHFRVIIRHSLKL
jgi:hypothetical protein